MNIAVYGTLRKGMGNWSVFKNGLHYQQTVSIPGFKLLDIGLPIITTDPESSVVCDLMEVTDKYIGRRIDYMELGAGYYIDIVEIPNFGSYKIYPFIITPGQKQVAKEISTGDYTKWITKKNIQ